MQDEEAELLAELERMKKERAAEANSGLRHVNLDLILQDEGGLKKERGAEANRGLRRLNLNLQDEEAELLAELERIKKERAAEAARKAAEEAASAEASAKDELIRGNPLILGGAAPFQARMSTTSVPCAACLGGDFAVPSWAARPRSRCACPARLSPAPLAREASLGSILGGAAPFQVRMSSASVPCAACPGGVLGVPPGRRGPVPGAHVQRVCPLRRLPGRRL